MSSRVGTMVAIFGRVVFSVAATLATAACGVKPFPRADGPGRGVILISIDTLRRDHLGCYGYPRQTTPNLDRFRADGILFEDASAHASATLASHATMFTSLLPQHHLATAMRNRALAASAWTLAEELRGRGLQTGAFTGAGQLAPEFGLAQGFETYDTGHESFGDSVDGAILWLGNIPAGKPYFLFLHTYETHHPYAPSAEHLERFEDVYDGPLLDQISIPVIKDINAGRITLSDADLRHIVAAYDGEIFSMDAALGELLEYMAQQRLYDDALIVFTSDHGEEFGEHGMVGWHSHSLYRELLDVPLIVKLPGARLAGTSFRDPVGLIDLAPTILAALNLPKPAAFSGVSLLASLDQPAGSRRALIAHQNRPDRELQSVRRERWKWIDGRLYDLDQDPGELTDVATGHPEVATASERVLQEILAARQPPGAHPVTPDAKTMESLRALGYVN